MKAIHKNKGLQLVLALIICIFTVVTSSVQTASAESYTYTIWDNSIPAPDAYQWTESIRAEQLGIEAISGISDLYYRNGKIYIAMTKQIVVTDEEFNTLFIISTFDKNGEEGSISAPKSVFVTKDNQIYVAEQDLGVIVQFDEYGNFVREIGDPGITGLESVKYAPTKVVVDDVGRIYVKAKSVYEGIIELDPNGNFNRFVGANEVTPSFAERFYRMIATEEQISRMELWLPTDYSDITIDKDGFLLATVKDLNTSTPIRKLNASGSDIMPEYDQIAGPLGDYSGGSTSSTLTTIAAAEDGRFAALDATRSRVFVYNEDGILAYVLGGSGKQEGGLNSPVDVAFMGDKILVADLVACSIEVYEPTEYGSLLNEGMRYESDYDYDTAASYYEQVYEINPNSIIANLGLGKYELRQENYAEAMTHFEATGERESYSQAYEYVREAFLNQNLGKILVGIIIGIILLVILKKLIRRAGEDGKFDNSKFVQKYKEFKYTAFTWPGYMLSHPFKAFDDVKYEDAGSTKFCFVIMLLFAWANLIKWKYTGFIVNYHDVSHLNIPLILVSSVFPYLIFIVANWAVGTLIDGKGNMRNIFKVNMYALYPTIFLYVIGVLLSRVAVYDEAALVNVLFYLPMVMYVFYTFIGLIMIHQFSFTKAVGSIVLSIIAMAIIIFIIMLLVTLVSGFTNDVFTIFDEISLYL